MPARHFALIAAAGLSGASCGGGLTRSDAAESPRPAMASPASRVAEPAWALAGQITDLPGRPFGIRIAPDGRIFVTQQDLERVTIVPPSGEGARDSLRVGDDPGDVILTPDGRTAIVSTFNDGGLHLLDAASGEERAFARIGENAYRLAVSASGNDVFVTTTSGILHRVAIADPAQRSQVQLRGALLGLARSSDGALATTSSEGEVTLLDGATLATRVTRRIGGTPQDLAFSPDGSRLYVAHESRGQLLVLDGRTLAPLDSIAFAEQTPDFAPFGLALSADGRTLAVTSARPAGVIFVETQRRTVTALIIPSGTPRRAVFSADGRTLFVANEGGWVDVIR